MEVRIAAEIAIEISENSWPAFWVMNSTGANTITVVKVDASTAGQTSRTPCTAACQRLAPALRCRAMFSSTTMLLSSVMPIANAMPANEMTLIVRPKTASPMNAAIAQIGTPMMAISVA